MPYFDEELLETKRELNRKKYTTLETGIYAGEELITFSKRRLLGSTVSIPLPDQFVIMPDKVKNIKYPYKTAPDLIITSLNSTVNIVFNLLQELLKDDDIKIMCLQFQEALKNINPTIKTKNIKNIKTTQGNEMSSFEYTGFHLDGQSYNQVYLIRLKKAVLHCTFSCSIKDKSNWKNISDKIFLAVEEIQ